MKAMILAAGRGERMRPLTDHVPKPLLKAGGHCLIEYHIRNLVSAGVVDLVINHAHLGDQLEQLLGDGHQYGARICYSCEAIALETAGGILNALPLLGDEPFIVVNGDVWSDFPFSQLPQSIDRLAHLVLVNNPSHNQGGDFALSDGQVVNAADNKLTFSGISILSPRLFSGLEAGPSPLAPLLRNAIEQGQVSGEYYSGKWFDIGTPQRLQELDQLLEQTKG